MNEHKITKPLGLPLLEGVDILSKNDWKQIFQFIKEKSWDFKDPCIESDLNDPLLMKPIEYGKLMLGFDFHITSKGPKLIEINTNAGGLASVFTFECDLLREHIQSLFINAILVEYNLGIENGKLPVDQKDYKKPSLLAIVDDDVQKQGMYPEMLAFAQLLRETGIPSVVISQEDMQLNENNELIYEGKKVEMIYNRICDFRFELPKNQHLRSAALHNTVILTPHPYSYARVGDKRNLLRLFSLLEEKEGDHEMMIIPRTYQLKDKPIEFWISNKKQWVFKPPSSNGSKGVYRGDKISVSKLKSLDADTIVQEYCEPGIDPSNNTKFDFRVFTRDNDILGLATRHYSGQIMEMSSPSSGLKAVLPEDVCCFPLIFPEKNLGPLVVPTCCNVESSCADSLNPCSSDQCSQNANISENHCDDNDNNSSC